MNDFETQVRLYMEWRGFDRATAEMLTREQGITPDDEHQGEVAS